MEACAVAGAWRNAWPMLTLSPGLAAATSSPTHTPAISLQASAMRRSVPILDFEAWYAGSENDTPHAACIAADGSLIRVRNDAGTIQVSRVALPASGSTYSSWTSLGSIAAAGGGVHVAASSNGAVLIVFVKTGGLRIAFRSSTNNGASFGGSGDVTTSNESSAVAWCATASPASGTFMVFWNRGATTLRRTTNAATPGSWAGAFTTHTISGAVASIGGMAAAFSTDYELVLTGTKPTTNDLCVLAATLGAGGRFAAGTLGPWMEIQAADASSTITFLKQPSIACYDSTALVTWCEKETGDVAYTRSYLAVSEPDLACQGLFTEPEPLASTNAFGAAIAHAAGSNRWYLTTANHVWAFDADDAEYELGVSVAAIDASLGIFSASLRADLVVTSTDVPAGLRVGGQVDLRAGYDVAGLPEYGAAWRYQVTGLRHVLSKDGRLILRIEGDGQWELAARTIARQAVYAAGASGSRAMHFRRALARAGGVSVAAAGSPHAPSSQWTTSHQPELIAMPGDSWGTVARRLVEAEAEGLVPDGATLTVRAVSASDGSDLAAGGPGEHPVLDLRNGTEAPPYNWTRVSGPARYTDAYLAASVASDGARLRHFVEADATTNTKTIEYANAAIARARWSTPRGTATIPVHPGLQLLDVATLQEPRTGLSADDYRVLAIALRFSREVPRYEQMLTLGGL